MLVFVKARNATHTECALHVFRQNLLTPVAYMRVKVHGRLQLGMPEPFLNVFHVPALVV